MADQEEASAKQNVAGSLPSKRPLKGRPRQFAELRNMSLNLEPAMLKRLKDCAERENTSFAELCRSLLAKGLDDLEQKS
jgi:hypothetical protein